MTVSHESPTRTDTDSLGPVEVPSESLWGASTQRALNTFPESSTPLPRSFIHSLGLVKKACAAANAELGKISLENSELIQQVTKEIAAGKLDSHFPVSVFQTGSGTSSNMNANEVIANRCSQLSGKKLGSKDPIHPNDHANLGQSSNDVIPTTLHLSLALALKNDLRPALSKLRKELAKKSENWSDTIKLGRTHLMDAVPITIGQEFGAFARQIEKSIQRADRGIDLLGELAIGGTAVGSGLNTHPQFGTLVCRILSTDTAINFREAINHFEAQSSRDDAVELAGILCAIATALSKVSNDIRLLGTGPRAGLGELQLPETQPGSSIMPGKVNPVLCESLVQSCHSAIGHCQTAIRCGQDGHLQLNATLPLLASSLHQAIEALARGCQSFTQHCVEGLQANTERCQNYAKNALGLATALNPKVGYDSATKAAQLAHKNNTSIHEAARELKLLDAEQLEETLDPKSLALPHSAKRELE
ncbi:class II fumarate hydratase [Pelagicoccus sp. SDUM812002]|uniref:class II fumarate hydratase n=1 Tax=Pelagicoccus sp. SDUM812002 TaxID=3041266 RepID=UPI00281062B3|nr:class II fumarate hydratase [Pelagicoccus sp. SDUM812002]MDQ8187132.1 class II fumarate hydratase [Pelagicoccus sp. SDUM812002]